MSTITVEVITLNHDYPFFHQRDVSISYTDISFKHIGRSEDFVHITEFIDKLSNAMEFNNGRIKITVTEVDDG